jgi:zinc transporter ZupT
MPLDTQNLIYYLPVHYKLLNMPMLAHIGFLLLSVYSAISIGLLAAFADTEMALHNFSVGTNTTSIVHPGDYTVATIATTAVITVCYQIIILGVFCGVNINNPNGYQTSGEVIVGWSMCIGYIGLFPAGVLILIAFGLNCTYAAVKCYTVFTPLYMLLLVLLHTCFAGLAMAGILWLTWLIYRCCKN